jgi:hypothetical protein
MPTIPYILPAKPVKPKSRRKRRRWRDKTAEQKQPRRARYTANRRRARVLFGDKGFVPPEVAKQEFAHAPHTEGQDLTIWEAIDIATKRYDREGATPEERHEAAEMLRGLLDVAERVVPVRQQLRKQAFQGRRSGPKNPVDK